MLATLDVPYVDTTATDLVWALDHPPTSALAATVLPLDTADGSLELRILGASHQALLHTPRGSLVETVACLPGRRAELPGAAERRIGGLRYRFRARVEHPAADALRSRVRELRRRAELDGGDGRTVLAEFPAHPDAVTVLSMRETASPGVCWETWHVYPNSRQIVMTSTEVR